MLDKIKKLANKLSDDFKNHDLVKKTSENLKKNSLVKNLFQEKSETSTEEKTIPEEKADSAPNEKSEKSDVLHGIFSGDQKSAMNIKGVEEKKIKKTGRKFKIQEYINEKHKDSDTSLYRIVFQIYNYLWFIFSVLTALLIGTLFFFYINLDKEVSKKYDFLDKVSQFTLIKHVENLEKEKFDLVRGRKDKLKRIKQYTGEIPAIIYTKSFNFQKLSENLKKGLKEFYNFKNGKIKKLNIKEKRKLEEFFIQNKSLNTLKIVFEDEHVLHSIINNRIYWKNVYRDLKIVTDEIFNYNEILNYVIYSNLSISDQGNITVSGKITSPHGNTFSGLIDLVKGINRYGSFQGAKVSTFSKNKNPNGSFSSFINLKFKYIK